MSIFNRKLKKRIEELEGEIIRLKFQLSTQQFLKEESESEYKFLQEEHNDYVLESSLRFSLRRFIVGKQGSGKTVLLRSILPYLNGNYFIIDSFNEYKEFPEKNRFAPDNNLSLKEKIQSIIEAIAKNKDKVIIYDGLFYKEILDFIIIESNKLNFIITAQSKKQISCYLNYVDLIYDKGTMDNFAPELEISLNKLVRIENKAENLKFS